MKKDRNNFFPEYGFNGANPPYNQGYMMPGAMPNFPGGMPNSTPLPTDIDARIAKLERSLNRLETRVSKLEGDSGNSYENDYNYNNSMYMV